MKNQINLLILLLLSTTPIKADSKQWRTDGYDSRWLPITDKEVAREVRSSSKDAVSLYRLYNQARYQNKEQSYFSALQKIKQEQPKNGVVLATYCAILMESNQMYGFGQFKFKISPEEGTVQSIAHNLELAKKLEPKLWIIFLTEADIADFTNGNQLEGAKNAVSLCRKAVKLAPNLSFTQTKLGYWLGNLARQKKEKRIQSINCYKKAQKLRPINCDASFLLLNVYRFYEPNPVEARKTAQAVLDTIPPSVKIDSSTRLFLAKQGVSVPKNR